MVEDKGKNTYLENLVKQLIGCQLELNRVLNSSQIGELKAYIEEVVERKFRENLHETQQDFYTRQDAAKKLGISLVTLDKYIKAGVIKASRLGKSIRISENDLSSALKEIKCLKHKY